MNRTPDQQAHDDGVLAYDDGKSLLANPFSADAQASQHRQWIAGWYSVHEMHLDEEPYDEEGDEE